LELEEAIPPLVANGYPLSGGNSNKKKKAYAPLSLKNGLTGSAT
jgi:hypothetical protein